MNEKQFLSDYPNLDPHLAERFEALKPEMPRDPQAAAQTRAVFLERAQGLKAEMAKAVSVAPKQRHIGWIHSIQSRLSRKEGFSMFGVVSTLLIIFSLMLGGAGISVAAAQTSLPDQPLYALKLFTEQVRLRLNSDPEQAWQLSLEFANRRMNEIKTMMQGDEVPPEPVQGRYQEQVEQALRLAVNQPDDRAVQALEQIRERLQLHSQTLQGLPPSDNPQVEAARLRTQQLVQERLRWVEEGLTDPAQLREQIRFGQPPANGNTNRFFGSPTPGSGYGPGPGDGDCPDCVPVQNQQGGNPWTDTTPTPGSGYGPGPGDNDPAGGNPWTEGTPTPGSGYGPGPGDGDCPNCTPEGNSPGGNPWTDTTPTPGSGYGPGPQPTEQPGSGPQATAGGNGGKP